MDKIKPIETVYNGYRFRSRLEARWAVFFDEMGIKYQYEGQGFSMKYGIRYLPDFILTNVRWRGENSKHYTGKDGQPIYVEIKGVDYYDQIPSTERIKISMFAQQFPLLVLGNIPQDAYNSMCDHMSDGIMNYRFLDGDEYACFFSKYKGEIWLCGCDHDEYNPSTVERALVCAKMARFEHNEMSKFDVFGR